MPTTVSIASYTKSRWPVHTPIPIIVSGYGSECKFKYIAEVYVSFDMYTGNGSPTWTKVSTMKQSPDPTGNAVFDIHAILQNYVSHFSSPETRGAAAPNLASYDKFDYIWAKVDLGCEYDDTTVDCSGVPTQYTAQVSLQLMAWNAGLPYEVSIDMFHPEDWFQLDTGTGFRRFLINAPQSGIPVRMDQGYTIKCHSFGTQGIDKIVVKAYLPTGTLFGTFEVDTSAYDTPTQSGYDLLTLGVGPWNLNNVILSSGVQPVITQYISYYEVYVRNSGGTRLSEILRFNVDQECAVGASKTVTWLNRWGGMDTFTFTKNNLRTVPIKRTSYERIQGNNLGTEWSWLPWGAHGGDRGKSVLSVDARDKWKLTSGFVSEDVAVWLEELFTSPAVYMIDEYLFNNYGSGSLYQLPMTITSTSYEEKDLSGKKLVFYQIEMESAVDKIIQRG